MPIVANGPAGSIRCPRGTVVASIGEKPVGCRFLGAASVWQSRQMSMIEAKNEARTMHTLRQR
jgi:hypothetical protein